MRDLSGDVFSNRPSTRKICRLSGWRKVTSDVCQSNRRSWGKVVSFGSPVTGPGVRIAGAHKIPDDLKLLPGNRVRLHERMPLDAQSGRFENIHLLAHVGKGDQRIERAVRDEKALLQGHGREF